MSSRKCRNQFNRTAMFSITTVVTVCASILVTASALAKPACEEAFADHHITIKNLDLLYFNQKKPIVYFRNLFAPALNKIHSDVTLFIIAPWTKISEIAPEFSHLKGRKISELDPSHSGDPGEFRLWDDVGGLARGNLAVVRSNFVATQVKGSSQTLYHELGHIIETQAFDQRQTERLEELFQNALRKAQFVNGYSSLNVHEYFAEAVEAFASDTKDPRFSWPEDASRNRKQLQIVDPDLYEFVRSLTTETI